MTPDQIEHLLKLAMRGEIQTLTYKARLDELVQQHRSLEAENAKLRAVAEAAKAWQNDKSGQPAAKYNAFLDALAALDKPTDGASIGEGRKG